MKVLLLSAALLGMLACNSAEQVKRDQYYAEGAALYALHCANCHQADGAGMANLYPPLHYLGLKDRFICIVKNGISEEITVNGVSYNRPMPANPKLTDLEIAEITTYVYNTWGEETAYTRIDSVKAALNHCQP